MDKTPNKKQKKLIYHSATIQEICNPLFEKTEINGFGYFNIKKNGALTYLGSSGKWMEHFFVQELHTLLTPENIPEIFQNKYIIGDHLVDQSIPRQTDLFGYYHIFCVINETPSGVDLYSFTASDSSDSYNNRYINNIDKLNSFCSYFDEAARPLVKEAKKISIPVTKIKRGFSNLTRDTNNDFPEVIPQKWYLGKAYGDTYLTKNETMCLHYMLLGNSARKISSLMFKSSRTIEYYMNRIKQKFNVRKKADLIQRVLRTNFKEIFFS